MVYYNKKMKIKISKGKGPGEIRWERPTVLSQWSHMHRLILLAKMYDSTYEVLPTREAPLSLNIQGFIGSQYHRYGVPAWLTLLSLQQPLPTPLHSCPGQTDTAWPKGLTINHIVSTDYLGWPKAPYSQTFYHAGYFKDLEVIFQEVAKANPFFGMCGVWTTQAYWIHPLLHNTSTILQRRQMRIGEAIN